MGFRREVSLFFYFVFILIIISAYHSAALSVHSTKPLHWFLSMLPRPHSCGCRQIYKGELNISFACCLFFQISSIPFPKITAAFSRETDAEVVPGQCAEAPNSLWLSVITSSIQFPKSASFSVASRAKEVQGKWDGPGPKSMAWHS